MNPRKTKSIETDPVVEPDPFREPHTIPAGWDVSAFYPPEQENFTIYGRAQYPTKRNPTPNSTNEEA
jgi:hypothetical protein